MSAVTYADHRRDMDTVRTAGGVRLNPEHWASVTVHSFRTWTGQTTLATWCGVAAALEDGARETKDLPTCLQCAEASWQAVRYGLWF